MASHGIPRVTDVISRSEAAIKRELQQIEDYQKDVKNLSERVQKKDFSNRTLELCAKILSLNPEYYTVWNHRRRILLGQWDRESTSEDQVTHQISDDLNLLTPLMLKYPKCYWIWNYRLWLLHQTSRWLAAAEARAFWIAELALVSKMLLRDERNFHGWRYRRMVVIALESESLSTTGMPNSLVRQEFDYTTEKIHANLSNFSAWHNRSILIPRILNEGDAGPPQQLAILDQELDLIHEALIDPYDQSLWFYHACIMAAFEPTRAHNSIAPDLTQQQRLNYIEEEMKYVLEMLEDTTDCKWIYLALLDLSKLYCTQSGHWPLGFGQANITRWMEALQGLDPARKARWQDLRAEFERINVPA